MPLWPKKRWKQALLVLLVILVVTIPVAIALVSYSNREPTFKNTPNSSSLTLSSPAFTNEGTIPVKYTAQGANVNPPLDFNGIPEGTISLVVTVNDPVLPSIFAWNHWVIWNISPSENLTENSAAGIQGRNGWNKNEYGGPDPLSGTRRYIFTVYALDTTLSINEDSRLTDVLRAMDNHVLGKAQLIGTYAK